MISRTKHGIRILTAAALAGATIAAGTGAASAQTRTAPGTPTTAQSGGVAAKTGEIACKRGYVCLYEYTHYRWVMTRNKPSKAHPYKCNIVQAWVYNGLVKSYQNRTTYKVKLYWSSHWRRTIPQRGKPGAFSTDTKLKGKIAYVCFAKP